MTKKLSARNWCALLLAGLVGQFAWTIENMYFNVFLYRTISTNPDYIAAMVAASAIVATLTTLLMGALSDRLGKRKVFICAGYILWGISVMLFGVVSLDRIRAVFPMADAVKVGAFTVIILDCVMTFFGSTANDAAFNAYITDITCDENRGKIESVLATLPLLSMLIIFGLFDGWTQSGKWSLFFCVFGALVILTGILSMFLIHDPQLMRTDEPYFRNLLYGFSPRIVRAMPELYLALLAFTLFSIGVQVFFPYLIVYFQYYLLMDNYAIVLGIVLIVASIVSVILGRYLDRLGKMRVAIPAMAVMTAGLVALYFARSFLFVVVSGAVMMSGYMALTAVLSAVIRDRTPKEKVGHFQGVRMVFAVMLPMVIGPFIGSAVIKSSTAVYEELGQAKTVPTPHIFLAAACCVLLTMIPVILYQRKEHIHADALGRNAGR